MIAFDRLEVDPGTWSGVVVEKDIGAGLGANEVEINQTMGDGIDPEGLKEAGP